MAGKSKGGREVRKPKHVKPAKTPEVPAVIVKTSGPKKAK
jgi:hypothetical protein